MTRYNDIQAANKRKYRESVKRQCQIVDPNISDDVVDQVLDNGTEGLFTGKRVRRRGAEDVQERVHALALTHVLYFLVALSSLPRLRLPLVIYKTVMRTLWLLKRA